jgi:hypothetical protein
MSAANNDKRGGVVPAGLGGNHRRGGGPQGGGVRRTDAPTKSALDSGVQPGQGQATAEQASDVFIFTGRRYSVGDAQAGIYKPKDNLIDKKVESAITRNSVGDAGIARDNEIDIENDSFENDAVDVSTLDFSSMDDSNVNLSDITAIDFDKSFSIYISNKSKENHLLMKANDKDNENDFNIVKANGDRENVDVLMDTDENASGERVKVKGKRSFPQSTNDRRFKNNQKKADHKKKYSMPEDPFMAAVDKEYMKRKSYADCVKEKDNIILEIRCEDLNLALDQDDFKSINSQLLFKYLEAKQATLDQMEDEEDEEEDEDENDDPNNFFYGVIGGISNGAVWLACDNQITAEFVKHHVPLIKTKGKTEYKYKVFTSEARPWRYMKAKVPVEFWGSRKTIEGAFIASNSCLNRKCVVDAAGKKCRPHFKICFGCENYDDDLDENDSNYYWLQFSIDERLMNKLAELKGRLRLGATSIQLLGGGMVTKAKEVIAEQMKEATNIITDASG